MILVELCSLVIAWVHRQRVGIWCGRGRNAHRPGAITRFVSVPGVRGTNDLIILNDVGTSRVLGLRSFPAPNRAMANGRCRITFNNGNTGRTITTKHDNTGVTFVTYANSSDVNRDIHRRLTASGVSVSPIDIVGNRSANITLVFIGNRNRGIVNVRTNTGTTLSPTLIRTRHRHVTGTSTLLVRLRSPLRDIVTTTGVTRRGGAVITLGPTPTHRLPSRLLTLISVVAPGRARTRGLANVHIRGSRSTTGTTRMLRRGNVHAMLVALKDHNM